MEYMEGLKQSQIVNMFIDEYLSIKESYFAFAKIYICIILVHCKYRPI